MPTTHVNLRLMTQVCGLSPFFRGHLPGSGRPWFGVRMTFLPQWVHIYWMLFVGMKYSPSRQLRFGMFDTTQEHHSNLALELVAGLDAAPFRISFQTFITHIRIIIPQPKGRCFWRNCLIGRVVPVLAECAFAY